MGYNFEAARAAGVSDTDIVEHLKQKGEYTYKFDDARKAGVSDTDIVEHLKTKTPSAVPTSETIAPVEKPTEAPISVLDRMQQLSDTKAMPGVQETVQPSGIIPSPSELDLQRDLPEKALDRKKEELTKVALNRGDFPVTERSTGIVSNVPNQGLQDTSIDIIPIGKLGILDVSSLMKTQPFKQAVVKGKAIDFLKKEFSLTDEFVDKAIADYSRYIDTTGMKAQDVAVKAVSHSLSKEEGEAVKTIATAINKDVAPAIRTTAIERQGQVLDKLETGNIEDAYRAIKLQKGEAVENFEEFREVVKTKFGQEFEVNSPVIDTLHAELKDEASKGIALGPDALNVLNTIEKGGSNYNLDDLISLRQNLGSIAKGSSDKRIMQINTIKSEVDKVIDANMPDSLKNLYSNVKAEYRLSKALEGKNKDAFNSEFGKILSSMHQGKNSYVKVLKSLSRSSASKEDLSIMLQGVGIENMTKFEKGLIAELARNKKSVVDFAKISDQLRSIEFVTKEGKQLRKLIEDQGNIFRSDTWANKGPAIGTAFKSGDTGAIASSVQTRVEYAVRNGLWSLLGKRFSPSADARYFRNMKAVSDVLAKPGLAKDINLKADVADTIRSSIRKAIQDDFDKVGRIATQTDVDDYIKQNMSNAGYTLLKHDPKARITGDVNLTPLYATEKGTVGVKATDVALHDSQLKLLRESLDRDVADTIMPEVTKYMETKRMENILKDVTGRLSAKDKQANIDMLRKIVTKEAEILINNVNKAHGVKLNGEEVQKIIKMKMAKLMEECK